MGQTDDGDRDEGRDDDEELRDLVVDGGGQAAEGDVGEHEHGGHDDGGPLVPAEHGLKNQGHGVQVDAGLQDGGHGEAQRHDDVRALAEALVHELRHRAHAGAVVERHHEDAEEHHARHGTDQVVVDGRHADLGAVGSHAQDLGGAQVGGAEREACNPRRHRTTGEQEVLGGFLLLVNRIADPHDHGEVDDEDKPIHPAQRQANRGFPGSKINHAAPSFLELFFLEHRHRQPPWQRRCLRYRDDSIVRFTQNATRFAQLGNKREHLLTNRNGSTLRRPIIPRPSPLWRA